MAIIGSLVPISLLGELVGVGTLFAFVIVSIGIIVLTKSEPKYLGAAVQGAILAVHPDTLGCC